MKKFLLFFSLLFVLNVCADSETRLIECNYSTDDAKYKVSMHLIKNADGWGISDVGSGETWVDGNVYYPIIVHEESKYRNESYKGVVISKDERFEKERWAFSFPSVSESYMTFQNLPNIFGADFEDALLNGNTMICPILIKINGKTLLLPPYYKPVGLIDFDCKEFNDEYYTGKYDGYVTNKDKDLFRKFFNGNCAPEAELISADNITIPDSDFGPDGVVSDHDWSKADCKEYMFLLREFRLKIAGEDGSGGVCSKESLNLMQKAGTIYDLKNNFDSSLLEPECARLVFSESGGYLDVLEKAQDHYAMFVKDTSSDFSIVCYSMESEIIEAITLLTSDTLKIEIDDLSGCKLIGDNTLKFLSDLFDVFKILCTVICIFLCMVDAHKVVLSKEADISILKKTLFKRLIALVAIFLIPIFVSIVAEYINERYMNSKGDICLEFAKGDEG